MTDEELASLSPGLRDFLLELLLFKSMFTSKWFEQLGEARELVEHRGDFTRLAEETRAQAKATIEQLKEWNAFPGAPERLDPATRLLRTRLFESLLSFKGASTEVFLAAAMQAPTDGLRTRFKELADRDRQHADRLREVLGTRTLQEILVDRQKGDAKPGTLGAHEGRDQQGSLSSSIEAALERFRSAGSTPRRIVLGSVALRHVRDEGALDPDIGTLFELPVDVDLGWDGECFSIETASRTTVAEIITSMRAGSGTSMRAGSGDD